MLGKLEAALLARDSENARLRRIETAAVAALADLDALIGASTASHDTDRDNTDRDNTDRDNTDRAGAGGEYAPSAGYRGQGNGSLGDSDRLGSRADSNRELRDRAHGATA